MSQCSDGERKHPKLVPNTRNSEQDVDQQGWSSTSLGGESKATIRDGGSPVEGERIISTLLVDPKADNQLGGGKRKRESAPKQKRAKPKPRNTIAKSNGGDAKEDRTTGITQPGPDPTAPTTPTNTPIIQDQPTTNSTMGSSSEEAALGHVDCDNPDCRCCILKEKYENIERVLETYREKPFLDEDVAKLDKWELANSLHTILNTILDGEVPEGSTYNMEQLESVHRQGRAIYKFFYPDSFKSHK